MEPFLKQIAKYLISKHGNALKDQTMVFANRRAALFFQKHLKQEFKEPAWCPTIITISELFESISEHVKADKLSLLFQLYEAYIFVMKQQEPFDQFYYWGNMMLRDFDEIDKYLIDSNIIFSNVLAYKEIENSFEFIDEEQKQQLSKFWEVFQQAKDSEQKAQFEHIWNRLEEIYTEFNKRCEEHNLYYEGKIYRSAIEKLVDNKTEVPYQNMHLVGFNALNRCERTLFKRIQDAGLGEFYWDGDQYYISQNHQEAGLFIRRNLEEFPHPLGFELESNLAEQINNGNININSYAVGMEIGQAIKAGELLSEIDPDKQEQTAIILPDENLLLPVLQSIPKEVEKINISMGYSFKSTPLFALVENILSLQHYQNKKARTAHFHFKYTLPILNHPYIFEDHPEYIKALKGITSDNLQWIQRSKLPSSNIVKHLFATSTQKSSDFNGYILQLLFLLYNRFKNEKGRYLELEFIYHTYIQIQKFDEQINKLGIELEIGVYLRLFRQVLHDIAVPFIGEPLDGLQIMGVLETRTLDFDNLFMLSLNEGSMPASSVDSSFIPYSLRRGYGLPTIEEYDAVYAYYFYRLIQRSKNVHLFYNNIQEGEVRSEKSRFLQQLYYELKEGMLKEHFEQNTFEQENKEESSNSSIEDFKKAIARYRDPKDYKYLTPSALNKLLDCPQAFYYRYVSKLYELEEISGEIDSAAFGNILHAVLEELYKPFLLAKLEVQKQDIEAFEPKVKELLDNQFLEILGLESRELEGDNFVARRAIEEYITKVLIEDKAYAPFKIVALESIATDYLATTDSGYRISGKIDRIDLKDRTLRVIDYKTGSVDYTFPNLEKILFSEGKFNKYALQAFTYSSLVELKHPEFLIEPKIIGVKDLYDSKNTGNFRATKTTEEMEKGLVKAWNSYSLQWLKLIDQKLSDIENHTEAIKKTEDSNTCGFCEFKGICNRG